MLWLCCHSSKQVHCSRSAAAAAERGTAKQPTQRQRQRRMICTTDDDLLPREPTNGHLLTQIIQDLCVYVYIHATRCFLRQAGVAALPNRQRMHRKARAHKLVWAGVVCAWRVGISMGKRVVCA